MPRQRISAMMPRPNQVVACRCTRDNAKFSAIISDYPGNRRYIECPTCGRRYFFINQDIEAAADLYDEPLFENAKTKGVFEIAGQLAAFHADRLLLLDKPESLRYEMQEVTVH